MNPPRNNLSYRRLAAFQVTTLLIDATKRFLDDFLYQEPEWANSLLRTALSARHCAAMGCRGWQASEQGIPPPLAQRYRWWEFEQLIKCRAKLEILLLSYEDYLRWRQLPQWNYTSEESSAVRAVANQFNQNQNDRPQAKFMTELSDMQRWELYSPWLIHADPAVRVNAIINIIHQSNYLIERQLENFEWQLSSPSIHAAVVPVGNTNTSTSQFYSPAHESSPSIRTSPTCPSCGGSMRLRVAKQGQNPGKQFWGCIGYPNCRGVAEVAPT